MDKSYFLSLSDKLFFTIEDDILELLVKVSDSLQSDILALKGFNLKLTPIFYCNDQLSLKMDESDVDVVEIETESYEVMCSLANSYVFSNIKLHEKK